MVKLGIKSDSFSMGSGILPIGLKIFAIAFATFALFYQDLGIIFSDALTSEINNFILIVPVLFLFLVYRKRKMLKAVIPIKNQSLIRQANFFPVIVGFLLLFASIVFYWHGSYTSTPLEFHMLVFPVFIAGLTLFLFNLQTLWQIIFPLLFLLFLLPPPSEILYLLGSTLSVVSSQVSFWIVSVLGIPSILTSQSGNPTIIITRANGSMIPFSVDVACSGVYGLIGFFIFAAFVAYLIRDKFYMKLMLFVIGFPLIFFLNLIRITSIILVGYQFGEELALEMFHLLSGWVLIFLGTLFLLLVSEKVLRLHLFTNPAERCRVCDGSQKVNRVFCAGCGKLLRFDSLRFSKEDLVKVLAIFLGIIFIMSIQVPVFALTNGGEIDYNSASGQFSTEIFPEIQNYSLVFRNRDFAYEELVNHDLAVWYVYVPSGQSDVQNVIHVSLEISQSWSSMHSLYYCLNVQPIIDYGQPKVSTIEYKDIQLAENPPIIAKYFVFQNETTNQLEAAIWWYENPIFSVNSTAQQKIARITLITYPSSLDDLSLIEAQFVAHARSIAEYWEPVKSGAWSSIALSLSQNGDKLAVLMVFVILGLVLVYFFVKRKENNVVGQVRDKISQPNRQIFDVVSKTERNVMPTFNNILSFYQKLFDSAVDEAQLMKELLVLERSGLLKRVIFNVDDEPVLGWTAQNFFGWSLFGKM